MAFSYTPSDGLNNTSTYKTTPDTEALARSQFMDLFNQVKNELNNVTYPKISGITSGLLSVNGYIKIHIDALNKDLILQWGSLTVGSGGGNVVTYPIPFTTAVYIVMSTNQTGVSNVINTLTLTTFNIGSAGLTNWIAIGY